MVTSILEKRQFRNERAAFDYVEAHFGRTTRFAHAAERPRGSAT